MKCGQIKRKPKNQHVGKKKLLLIVKDRKSILFDQSPVRQLYEHNWLPFHQNLAMSYLSSHLHKTCDEFMKFHYTVISDS